MKLWIRQSNKPGADNCAARRPLLSRYLDNDLRGEAAAGMAAHLRSCAACRAEFEAYRAQRAILAASTLPRGAAAARARVLTRFEQAVREQSPKLSESPTRPMMPRYAFAAMLAVVGMCGIVAFRGTLTARPKSASSAPLARGTSVAAPAVVGTLPLPERNDLDVLLALHDARAKADAPAPKETAHLAANPSARGHRRTRSEASATRYAAAHPESDANDDVVGEAAPLSSDELPEAL